MNNLVSNPAKSAITDSSDSNARYLSVALPVPLRQVFDYQLPPALNQQLNDTQAQQLAGCRVKVRFGAQKLVGIILACHQTPSVDPERIKPVQDILDAEAMVPAELLRLCWWAAHYYHHPIGDVIQSAMPLQLRQGKTNQTHISVWTLTTEAKGLPESALKRAPKQQKVLQHLLNNTYLSPQIATQLDISNTILVTMAKKGLLEKKQIEASSEPPTHQISQPTPPSQEQEQGSSTKSPLLKETPPALNGEQQVAVDDIRYHHFNTYLLEGATGSGKTEVYLQIIARVLQAGQQALVLIPEIGLSPQTVKRFTQRFHCEIAELHSNISEAKRAQHWLAARNGTARIIIGTRLASLTPTKNLGAIIVDEEHDLSFKQQEGLRYSARDLSIYRASTLGIPIVLGSATPSFESLHNAIHGRYHHLRLTRRAGSAKPPTLNLVDLRQQQLHAGLSNEALEALENTLARGHQAIVFINRRGFAPTLLCHHCGWAAECRNCDAHLTLHRSPLHLHCHHCDAQQPVVRQCPSCKSTDLNPKGLGTEQTEQLLQQHFPNTTIMRIDRDSTQKKQALSEALTKVSKGKPCILIGTQMLAKGHHLPNVALVIIVDSDQGLLSADFRGPERMGQLIVQVAGRAGREKIPGTVLIQSHTPDHPLLELLLTRGYHRFARELLNERQATSSPPFAHIVLFRAESKRAENAVDFLKMVANTFARLAPPSSQLQVLGPIPARMEKVKERFRYQLQLKSTSRKHLQALLTEALSNIDSHALSKRTRWSVDVDPAEV